MQIRAKTKKFIMILSTILSAVFALSVGLTFAATSKTKNYNMAPNAVSAYLGNNSYSVVNNASSVLFAEGLQNNEISIEYSYAYDFDIRIKYSMSWSETRYQYIPNVSDTYASGTYYSYSGSVYSLLESEPGNWETNYGDYFVLQKSTTIDNVILNFYDRNNWIVDDEYIFHTTQISAGHGTLKLLSGVSFIDPYDDNYLGLTLTVSIDEVKIVKDDPSNIEALFIDSNSDSLITLSGNEITSFESEAAAAYYHYVTDGIALSKYAFVIAYNPRYIGLNGAVYPTYDTAYSRTSSGVASWLGCNRYTANVGIYVVVGSSPVRLTAKVGKAWRNVNGHLNSTNNILENFNSSWDHNSLDGSDNEICDYHFVLPANSATFIPVVDAFEITSEYTAGNQNLYENSQAYIETLTLNNTNFNFATSSIEAKEIDTVSNGKSDSYSASDCEIINQSYLNNSLFRNAASTYYVPAYITNNSATDKSYTVTYSLNYRIGNGKLLEGSTTTFDNVNGYFYEETGSVSNGATSYYRVNGETFLNNAVYGNSETITVKAHSTKQIVYSFFVTNNFETYLASELTSLGLSYTSNADYYDVWVYLGVSVTSSSNSSASNISAYIVKDGTSVKVYAKNNTDELLTLTDLSVSVLTYRNDNAYSSVISSQPADWNSDYWRYYAEGSTVHNTSKTFTGTYRKKISNNYNGVSQTSTISASQSAINLLPNESYYLGTLDAILDSSRVVYNLVVNYSGSASTNVVKLVNAGTNNAYIENFSTTNSYYVRFSGTYSGSDTRIKADSGYNYYIGIIRPGQIFKVPMSVAGTLEYIQVANSTYSNADLSSWTPSDTILDYYTTYFD